MSQTNVSYIPAFDGIRGISILMVFIAHLGYDHIVPGGLGVTIFFFISGFLITRLLIKEHVRLNTIELKNFFIRRMLRLYPPLLFFILVLSVTILTIEHSINIKEIAAAIFYYENYYVVFSPDLPKRFQILWSLSIEEHFYLVFPFLFMLFIRRPKFFLIFLVLLSLTILAVRLFVTRNGATEVTDIYTYSLSHCRADSILSGCLLTLLLHADKKNSLLKFASRSLVFCTASGILLFTLIYRDEWFRQTFRYALQGIALLFIFLPILYNTRYVFFARLLSNNILTYIGKLSYSIYLFHWVALYISTHYFGETSLYWFLTNILLTAVFALASYYTVEKSVSGLRQKFGSNVTS